jgi:hypothetical protein
MASKDTQSLRGVSPVRGIFDFPDFLSPMLVKELRQGLNTPFFIAIFIIVQALLLLIILSKILKSGAHDSHSFSPIIFLTFAVFVCGIQPLRALYSISAETSEKKMELVIITKLTPWKLVSGKWCSYMSQSLLITISLLPYLILSYLLGGMKVAHECFMYSSFFVGSGLGVALAILCSNISVVFFRFLIAGFLSLISLFIISAQELRPITANINSCFRPSSKISNS